MSNFFNAIGVADMEKVHSAVIGWLFSTECEALDIKQKSKLLCNLFGEPEQEFKTIKAEVEIYNIDILIITDENTPNASCWVIENKIKSSQHSNQLDKYVDIVGGEKVKIGRSNIQVNDYINISKHFCFLTLVDEVPQCTKCTWKNETYKNLAELLSSLRLQPNTDATILKEYCECINYMAVVLEDFLDNHQNYPHVFTDGSKKKTEKEFLKIKKDSREYALYIADNGLETIFQKCFLIEVIKQTKKFNSQPYKIKETHGTALWEYICETIKDTNLGIQFQNGTFKVQVLRIIDENLPQKKKEQLVKLFWDKWNNIFKTIPNLIPNWQGPNKSKEEKGPYFSFSMKTEQSNSKKWYSFSIEEIARHWDELYGKCQSALEILRYYVKQT